MLSDMEKITKEPTSIESEVQSLGTSRESSTEKDVCFCQTRCGAAPESPIGTIISTFTPDLAILLSTQGYDPWSLFSVMLADCLYKLGHDSERVWHFGRVVKA